jgi:hypothetical protein
LQIIPLFGTFASLIRPCPTVPTTGVKLSENVSAVAAFLPVNHVIRNRFPTIRTFTVRITVPDRIIMKLREVCFPSLGWVFVKCLSPLLNESFSPRTDCFIVLIEQHVNAVAHPMLFASRNVTNSKTGLILDTQKLFHNQSPQGMNCDSSLSSRQQTVPNFIDPVSPEQILLIVPPFPAILQGIGETISLSSFQNDREIMQIREVPHILPSESKLESADIHDGHNSPLQN